MSTIITKKQFPNYRKYSMDLAGRPLTLEVGKLAELANAAVREGIAAREALTPEQQDSLSHQITGSFPK